MSSLDFGTPKISERKSIKVSFASLSEGGAASRTLIVPSSSNSTTSFRTARGVTRTANAEPLLPSWRLNLRSDMVYLSSVKVIDERADFLRLESERLIQAG